MSEWMQVRVVMLQLSKVQAFMSTQSASLVQQAVVCTLEQVPVLVSQLSVVHGSMSLQSAAVSQQPAFAVCTH
jgi:hypothetical protein